MRIICEDERLLIGSFWSGMVILSFYVIFYSLMLMVGVGLRPLTTTFDTTDPGSTKVFWLLLIVAEFFLAAGGVTTVGVAAFGGDITLLMSLDNDDKSLTTLFGGVTIF